MKMASAQCIFKMVNLEENEDSETQKGFLWKFSVIILDCCLLAPPEEHVQYAQARYT